MTTPLRIGLSIALAAFALSLALPAKAQSWMPDGPLDTPNFLEAWSDDADAAKPADVDTAKPADDAPVRIKTRRPDPEAPAKGVTVARTGDESDEPKPRRLPAIIDQYPQNPRCYVAGRYVPAPPMCPN